METPISGKIRYIQVPASRALKKFTHKKIQNWISRKLNQSSHPSAVYQVEFRRQGAGHTFDCSVEISMGNKRWVGNYYEGGLHQALIRCLTQMTLLPEPV